MHFRFVVALLMTLALATACGGDPLANTPPGVPTPAGVPAIVPDMKSPLGPTPASGGARVTPTTVYPLVTVPTASPAIPTPTPTLPFPTVPAVIIVPGTPTPKPDPTEIHYDPTPTPTVDIAQQIARGMRLVQRNNCLGCHSLDGEAYSAPTLKGLFGSIRELEGGAAVTADEAYLWESIKRPNEKIVRDYFPDAMPTVFFNEPEINAMVQYIKSLSR